MGVQSSSRLAGDDYQHLYGWYLILQLLFEEAEFETAFVEHPNVQGAGDDVTLHRVSGSTKPSHCYQIKFHVGQGEVYQFETFLSRRTKKSKCLLEKLYETWESLTGKEPCQIWLVSNWSASPEDLGAFIDANYKFTKGFYGLKASAKHHHLKTKWQTTLGCDAKKFHAFAESLRLRLGFGGTEELKTMARG